jgi:hypothetical protein
VPVEHDQPIECPMPEPSIMEVCSIFPTEFAMCTTIVIPG